MANKPPGIKIAGIRSSIPSGYLLGRTSGGHGDVELLSMQKLQSVGLIPVTLPGPPTGAAGGDLSGTYPNPTVAKLQGRPVAATAPSNLAVLLYQTAGATWLPMVLGAVAYSNDYNDLTNLPTIHNVPAGGTTGQVLTKNSNTDYDISWVTPSAGGSSGAPASIQDDGTNINLALSDASGQLILDGSNNPIFAPEVFPPASLPIATSSAFGAVKSDDVTVQLLLGVLGTKFLGFLYTKASDTSVSDSIITKMVMDSLVVDTTGGAYNTATGKFTATKAGKYICFAAAIGQVATAMSQTAIWVAKNGTVGGGGVTVIAVAGMGQASFNTQRAVTAFVLGIADLNGTTDFIEFDAFVSGTGGSNKIVNPNSTFFGAFYAGA